MSHIKANRWVGLGSSAEGRLREREWLLHEYLFRKHPRQGPGNDGKKSSCYEWVPGSMQPQLFLSTPISVLVTV